MPEKTITESGVKKSHRLSRILITKEKPLPIKSKDIEPKITYEVVGTEEENQEKIDRVFDLIFEEVMKRREQKQGY